MFSVRIRAKLLIRNNFPPFRTNELSSTWRNGNHRCNAAVLQVSKHSQLISDDNLFASFRTVPAVVFWQFVNQSFNAIVNYTNRNANSPITTNQLGIAYVSATTSALVASLGYKSMLQKYGSPFFQRYAPFAAVAIANCVNIPLMRQNELKTGIEVEDENGNVVGKSRLASAYGITQVVVSRIVMAAPGMLILPVIMERLERRSWFRRMSILHAPFQVMMVGCFVS